MNLQGCYTALITPFDSQNNVSLRKLEELIEIQISSKMDGIVILGTTGEAPALSDNEQVEVVRTALRVAHKRISVIVGTGTNSFNKTYEFTEKVKALGADAALIVTPYYVRPSQEGLHSYYKSLNEIKIPIVIYNIPGRTGVNISPKTVAALSLLNNIIGIKESSGSIDQISEMCFLSTSCFKVLCGDDSLFLPALSVGASGVISVVGNLYPQKIKFLYDQFKNAKMDDARVMHQTLLYLSKALMSLDSNPIPIKAAMNALGHSIGVPRLPLNELEINNKKTLGELLM